MTTQLSTRKATRMMSNTPPLPVVQPKAFRSSWYLGGNFDIRLLTSVDGDFDPSVLNTVTAVPKEVADIAFAVESMVSHDFIIGDFESDLLAKIATNAPIPQGSIINNDVTAAPSTAKRAKTIPVVNNEPQTQIPNPITGVPTQAATIKHQRSPSMESSSFNVPNPLRLCKPVPNPLASPITPPESPVSVIDPITINSELSRKRKSPTVPAISTKQQQKKPVQPGYK